MDPMDASSYVSGKQSAESDKVKKRSEGGALGRVAASSGSKGLQAAAKTVESYHKGGKVRKTGLARLKKGETVLTKGQMQKMRKGKRRGTKSR